MKTLEPKTKASLPSQINLSRKKYAQYYADKGSVIVNYLSSFIPLGFASITKIFYQQSHRWHQTREQLKFGCLCPSIVFNHESSLIATFTNLNAVGERSFPFIKIHKEPFHMIPREFKSKGTRLVSSSIYWANKKSYQEGVWSDFTPIPLICLTDDITSHEAAFKRLLPLSWKALEMGIAQLDNSSTEGLYKVNIPHEIVWNSW